MRAEQLDQPREVIDHERGMSLPSGTEVRLDPEVDPDIFGLEPGTSPPGEVRGLGYSRHAQEILIERDGGVLLTGRHGELNVVDGPDSHG